MNDIVKVQRALADPSRVLIVRLLLEQGESCVCEIVAALDQPQYKTSRHLAVLRNAGLVVGRKAGQWVHYSISPTLSPAWKAALHALAVAWDEAEEVAAMRVDRAAERASTVPCCGAAEPGA
jgi:ArsR family transcriptional regulator, arsenate/arsenite/antimonite-responsive transcriptional repressor